jgi:hypothetical protein
VQRVGGLLLEHAGPRALSDDVLLVVAEPLA